LYSFMFFEMGEEIWYFQKGRLINRPFFNGIIE
jgi:hypothetical protein